MNIHIHPILCPAFALEEKSFNKSNQPKNIILKELLPRITAIVTPILYAYQFFLHGIFAIGELGLCLCGVTRGIIFQYAMESSVISLNNLFSSALEMPTKLIKGPNTEIKLLNRYFWIDRYHMKNHQFPYLL